MEAVFSKIITPIKTELNLVDEQLEKEMLLKAGHVSKFTKLDLDLWDKYLHPAVLILSARMFKYEKPQVVPMACVIQFVNIATGMHYGKFDDRPGFSVLIGDYLYAKFFSYLCDHDLLAWLPVISQIIHDIHEAGVSKIELDAGSQIIPENYLEIIKKQAGRLLAECSAFGAVVTSAGEDLHNAARSFGLNVGTAVDLIKSKQLLAVSGQLLAAAEKDLAKLPNGLERNILGDILKVITVKLQSEIELMVG